MRVSTLEMEFDLLWEELFPDIDLDAEQKIIPHRKFRFDYVHTGAKVAIEVNGGTYQRMGHSTGKGIERDYIKLNLAQAEGWLCFQLSSEMLNKEWLTLIADCIKKRTKLVMKEQA